jgi:hypothetical protein
MALRKHTGLPSGPVPLVVLFLGVTLYPAWTRFLRQRHSRQRRLGTKNKEKEGRRNSLVRYCGGSRVQAKAQCDLPEMIVTREDVQDAEVLHDDHSGKIDEGDVRLVLVFLPYLPSTAELQR